MDAIEFNKIAGGVLGTLLFTMALGIFSDVLFYRAPLATPGYALPGGTESTLKGASQPPAASVPLPVLLAKADAKRGQSATKPCTVCHNFEKGAGAKIGPPLYGVVGRPVASVSGYAYSDALKKLGGTWTFDKLFQFIANPKAMANGTKMTFPGEPNPAKRADILAYLDTLSDNPVPLPTAQQGGSSPAPAASK